MDVNKKVKESLNQLMEPTELNPDNQKKKKETKFDSESISISQYDKIKVKPKPFVPGKCPEIPLNSTITGFGKRKSGKTEFLKWFIQFYKQWLPWGWAFTRTSHNKQLGLIMPNKYIFPVFDADVFDEIKSRQVDAINAYLRDPSLNPRAFIIWDDYSGHDVVYNDSLKEYYMTGRHYQTMNFFFGQRFTNAPTPVRDNTDYVILWNTDNSMVIDEYYHEWAGKMDKNEFYAMFTKYCMDIKHGFLFIDNNPQLNYEDRFFYGIADLIKCDGTTIVGCKEYWKGSEKQLKDIVSGRAQQELDLLSKLGKPNQ